MPELSLDRPRRVPVWHAGYQPDPWPWTDWRWASDGRFPGRWDDPDGIFRTKYVGSTLLACLLEVLADFRADDQLSQDMAEIAVDDEDRERHPTIGAGRVDRSWLEPRAVGSAELSGDFCWVTHAESVAALRPHFIAQAMRLGLKDFDAAALKDGRPRQLTQAVAAFVYAHTGVDGIRFASRHGDDLELWAIFERGDSTVPPCVTDVHVTELAVDNPALSKAFALLGLTWSEEVEFSLGGDSADALPLPLEAVDVEEAQAHLFGGRPPTQDTPVGAAFLWRQAIEAPQVYRNALAVLVADPADWSGFREAREALDGWSIMQHPIHSLDRPGEVAYVKFIEYAGDAAVSFGETVLDDVWIVTVVKMEGQWRVWGLSRNYFPAADEVIAR